MYRNIDEDIVLLKAAKRYWEEEHLTKEQLYWVLDSQGYSKKEVDNAIGDYYYIHIRPERITHYLLIVCLIIVCLVIVYKLMN
jgi:cytochrome b subunit of formate dehydrogenase